MDAKSGGYQIDERRLIADFSIAEKFGARDVATAPVSLNPLPIINSLQNMLARFGHLQLNNNKPPILSERQQIDWPNAENAASGCPELRVQRRNYQAGIETGDVATQ
jgi:hypothetical protein